MYYSGRKTSLSPTLPQTDLPDEYFEAQRISYENADDMVFILACYEYEMRFGEMLNEARSKHGTTR